MPELQAYSTAILENQHEVHVCDIHPGTLDAQKRKDSAFRSGIRRPFDNPAQFTQAQPVAPDSIALKFAGIAHCIQSRRLILQRHGRFDRAIRKYVAIPEHDIARMTALLITGLRGRRIVLRCPASRQRVDCVDRHRQRRICQTGVAAQSAHP